MTDNRLELLVSEVENTLTKLPEKVRHGFTSPILHERLNAQKELLESQLFTLLVDLLKNSSLLPNPELMRVFANSKESLNSYFIAPWLIKRAAVIGASNAVGELKSYSTKTAFVAREIIVLDGVRVHECFDLVESVRLVPLTELMPTDFRDQFSESVPSQPPPTNRRAALVRTFSHLVIMANADDRIPDKIIAISQSQTLRDVARLFTLFHAAAPVIIAKWWEHDLSIPGDTPITSASVTGGFEASFHPLEINGDDVQKLMDWISHFDHCPDKLKSVLRIVLYRLNAAKRQSNMVDRAIDLGVAAEALFLRYEGEGNTEAGFRLATRAAWLLGSTRNERKKVFDDFRALYNARSTAVHSGELPSKINKIDISELLSRGCDNLVEAIIRTLENPNKDLQYIHLGEM